MKTIITLHKALFLLLMITIAGCSTEEIEAQLPQNTLDQNLKGTWNIESYLINNSEQIGSWIIESNMDFQGLDGETGTLYWQNITANSDTPIPFYYSISEAYSKIFIKDDEYSVQFKGGQLFLTGLNDIVPKEIVANKSN